MSSELTKVLQRGVQKALKVGKQEVARVIRVDTDKGYIDLSKKEVQPQDEAECLDKYAKAKTVHSILRAIAEKIKVDIQILYEKIVWPLYKKECQPLNVFKEALEDPKAVFDKMDIDENVKELLLQEIQRRLTPQTVRIRADIQLMCNHYNGVECIKQALLAGQARSRPNIDVRFYVRGTPIYYAIISTTDKKMGMEVMNEALKAVEESIETYKGQCFIKEKPKVVGDKAYEIIQNYEDKVQDDDEDEDSEDSGMGEASDDEVKEEEKSK